MKRRSFFRRRNVKRQDRRRRKRYLGKAIVFLTMSLALVWATHWALTHWEFFSLKTIEIRGEAKSLTEAQIKQKAQVKTGTNLFQVDLEAVQSRLQSHEYFKQISVHRRLPHTLVLSLKEFFPQFILYTGRFYYVDRSGEIFKDITDSKESRDFPILTGLTEADIINQPLRVREILAKAVKLKKTYQASGFAKRYGLSEIHFKKNIGFTLYPEKQKYSIKFGNKDFREKTKKLIKVMEKLDQGQAQFSSLDLNYPGKVLMTL